jgi:hypothetical protein
MDRWEAEGRRLARALDPVGAAVVLGADADAAQRVALGIARVQADKRRVALGDLIGDGPLASLVGRRDAHGLVDSFLYGVSLNHIAQRVEGHSNLFVLPCGTESPSAEVLTNPRWRRLAAGFREVGALLLIVPPPAAPHRGLVEVADGVVLVGDAPAPEGAFVLARAALPDAETREGSAAHAGESVDRPGALDRGDERAPLADRIAGGMVERRRAPRPQRRRSARPLVITLVAAAIAGGIWLGRRGSDGAGAGGAPPPVAGAPVERVVDSAAAGIDSGVAVVVANEADSAAAAAWGIELTAANTEAGAMEHLPLGSEARFPAATVSPVTIAGDTTRSYRVIVGAERTREGADSVLAALRSAGAIAEDAGEVVRVPFTVRLATDVPRDSAAARLTAMRLAGTPAYALRQGDGTVHVYLGAFGTPEQASALAETLRGGGVAPAVAYRTGRPD